MATTAAKMIAQANSWLGKKESDGSHKVIIDTYNAHKPLARSYTVKYTDSWCATFVSACAIKLGATDIIPTECSCGYMITAMKSLGIWNESDSRTPNVGDIVMYDWDDSGSGDCTGWPEHVGIVSSVSGSTFKVIEGNYSDMVKTRSMSVNGRYIRGYGVPKYTSSTSSSTTTTTTPSTSTSTTTSGNIAVDGTWGPATTTKAQTVFGTVKDGIVSNQLVKYRTANLPNASVGSWEFDSKFNKGSNLVKAIQTKVGVSTDGCMGPLTVKALQKFVGVSQDGCMGPLTVKAFQTWLNKQ